LYIVAVATVEYYFTATAAVIPQVGLLWLSRHL